ncbi:MAG: wax ester/triacylglycerol synthase domain-containing protein [Mycobacteriaceae bacterium]
MAALVDLVDRASAADVTSLVTDLADAPMHVGAVLLLGASTGWELGAAIEALEVRSRSVPRLRQRLQSAPFGCGRPFWVDDPAFSIDRHVTSSPCTGGSDINAVLRVAADIVGRPLPRDRPLWSATFVTGLDAGQVGLVVVFHHVLADGIGGLAVLANLVDGPDPSPAPELAGTAQAAPGTGALWLDATRARLDQVSGLPGAIRSGVSAIAAMRSDRPHRNTSVTNLHGPETSLAVLGAVVSDVIPISVATGNVTVSFAVLSYAGKLTVTVIADPRACPDLQSLTHLLQDELASLVQ